MREDCCHFQSRSYDDGEVARFCTLDLAPEAPWRCPADCRRYERLVFDATFEQGSLARRRVEDEPDLPGEDIAALLDEAEDIVNAAGPAILEELDKDRKPWWRRFGHRRGSSGDDGPFRLSDR